MNKERDDSGKTEKLDQRIEQISELAHQAIRNSYGDSWEQHRHSNFIDDMGNWHVEGESRENHKICPWPNIDYVIGIIAYAIAKQEQSPDQPS